MDTITLKGTSKSIKYTRLMQVGWRTFNGEDGYDFMEYFSNEDYKEKWEERNPNHKGWVDAIYIIRG